MLGGDAFRRYDAPMSTPTSVEKELGWALGTVVRNYLRMAGEALAEVPGGPRGYLVLAALGRGEPSTQAALAEHLGVDRTMMTYLLDDLEDAGLEEHMHLGLHATPPSITRGISFMIPRRRATSV